ncbi:MAG: putative sugar O-methyltransferase [Magnetococcales bacterium]|nr:putative sugar O-methyltransferase [Magnetococcales bacterium]
MSDSKEAGISSTMNDARDRLAQGDVGQAIALFNKVKSYRPESPEQVLMQLTARCQIADILIKNGKTKEAFSELVEALKVSPGFAGAHELLSHLAQWEPDLVVECWRRLVPILDPASRVKIIHRINAVLTTMGALEYNPITADILGLGRIILDSFTAATEHIRLHSDKMGNLVGKTDIWSHMASRVHGDFFETVARNDPTAIMEYLNALPTKSIGVGIQRYAGHEMLDARDPLRLPRLQEFLEQVLHLGEYLGVLPVDNTEIGQKDKWKDRDFDEIVASIEEKLGFPLIFPKVFTRQFGLKVRNGVVDNRATQAIYTASRICALLDQAGIPRSEAKVLEIGGGMGTLAYYTTKMGVGEYHIVDLPYINTAQHYLLGTLLGMDQISTFAYPREDAKVSVMPFFKILEKPDRYFHLVVNEDSMTEINKEIVDVYIEQICRISSRYFLSVNHESQAELVYQSGRSLHRHHRMIEATQGKMTQLYRFIHWMRPGYLEELFAVR